MREIIQNKWVLLCNMIVQNAVKTPRKGQPNDRIRAGLAGQRKKAYGSVQTQIDQQNGDIRGRNAADAGCLPYGGRTEL